MTTAINLVAVVSLGGAQFAMLYFVALTLVVNIMVLLSADVLAESLPGYASDSFSFYPSIRIQGRYLYDEADRSHDLMLRRVRLKAGGEISKLLDYYVEIKADNIGRQGNKTTAKIESGWVELPWYQRGAVRIGQYDVPFSRNLLTSDSKLLLMDRALITDTLAKLGAVDNTVGVLIHARPLDQKLEYNFGLFENIKVDHRPSMNAMWSKQFMPAARLVWHVFDPPPAHGYADYRGSWLGEGRRLSFGLNAARLGSVHDGASRFNLSAWGMDAAAGLGAISLESEYDSFYASHHGHGAYVQFGYYLKTPFRQVAIEPVFRFQSLDANTELAGDRKSQYAVGMNIYFDKHHLKLQSDYAFNREESGETRNDVFQIQLQLEF